MKRVSTTARLGVASVFLIGATLTGAYAASDYKRDGFRHHGPARLLTKFIEMDVDNDNKISLAEFLSEHSGRFEKADADSDGVITRDEAKAAIAKRLENHPRAESKRFKKHAPERIVRHMFGRFDLNDDGKISRAEQETHLGKRFALADRNDDKFVDVAEVERAVELFMGKGPGGPKHHRSRHHGDGQH